MKVKIKKEGNTKEFNLIKSWSDVTLEKWAKLAKLQGLTKGDEALETINTLSDIPKGLIKEFGSSTVVCCVDVKKNFFGTHKIFSHVKKRIISESFDEYLVILFTSGVPPEAALV